MRLTWFFILLLNISLLFGSDEEGFTPPAEPFTSSLVNAQNLISSVVDSVSTISGEWVQSETDFIILGPEPLILSRTYSGDHSHNHKLGYNWDFNRPHKLIINIEDKKNKKAKVKARLHHSSGVATIHECSFEAKKLDTVIPMRITRMKGMTNCLGEMSGKTNLNNTTIHFDWKKKHCAAITGSGLLTYYEFSHQQNLSYMEPATIGIGHFKTRLLNHYTPRYEKKPNGNVFNYSKGKISASNGNSSSSFSEIAFQNKGVNTLVVKASDGKKGTYLFSVYDHLTATAGDQSLFMKNRFTLTEARFTHKPTEKYEYTYRPPSELTYEPKNPQLIARRKPEGRFQEVEYYEKGTNSVDMNGQARSIKIDHTNDFRHGRVKVIKAPVGHNGKAVITHRFIYESEEHGGKPKKSDLYSGKTKVYDAYLHKTEYEYNLEHRITSLTRFNKKGVPYSEEHYVWDDRYNYPSNYFDYGNNQELFSEMNQSPSQRATPHSYISEKWKQSMKGDEYETVMKACLKAHTLQSPGAGNLLGTYKRDGDRTILQAHFFEYDKRGNIVTDTLYGNLTGKDQGIRVSLDSHKKPKKGSAESYQKRFTYSNDRLNLLLSEENENGKSIHYTYYPETDLISAKYIKKNGETRLRQFFHYDENATLIRLVQDNGSRKREANLTDVTERRITLFTPRKVAPLGLPEMIEHRCLDPSTQAEVLLKKSVYHHSKEGHLLQQDQYDSEGNFCFSLHWEYDDHGNIVKEVDAMGHTIEKEYDANDNLLSEVGPRRGDIKEYVYDYSNRLIEVKTHENGKKWSTYYSYDLVGNRSSKTDRYGNTTKYKYDEYNRLTRTVYPAITGNPKPQTTTEYDTLDQPILETDARGYPTAKTYNTRGKITSISHPNGGEERFEYGTDGTPAREVAANGTSVSYTYDFLGRCLKEEKLNQEGTVLYTIKHTYNAFHKTSTTDIEGVTTYFDYDEAGRLARTTRLDKVTVMEYDTLGRLARKREPFQAGQERVSCTAYNSLNQVIEERIEDEGGVVLKKVRYEYDPFGNRTHVIEETAAGNSSHITRYNRDGKPILMVDPEGRETHITYDEVKNALDQTVLQMKMTDPLGRQTFITYDALEYPTSIVKKDPYGILLARQDLLNDAQGNVLQLTDYAVIDGKEERSIQTTFDYDESGLLSCLTQAKGLPEQRITHTKYNKEGQKTEVIQPNGVTLSYRYDPLGRIERQIASDGTIHYTYSYNTLQQLCEVKDHCQNSISSFTYDKEGRLSSETLPTGVAVRYRYDALDRVESLELPDGCLVKYFYNALNLQLVARFRHDELLYMHSYDAYDLSGQLLQSTNLAGHQLLFSYDIQKRFHSLEHPHYKQEGASYDRGGRLTGFKQQDIVGDMNIRYEYDDNDHLIREEGVRTCAYHCNSLHDRLMKNQKPSLLNSLHQLLSDGDTDFFYSLSGNLEKKKKDGRLSRYDYDAFDRLISFKEGNEETTYLYDAFNRRIEKRREGQTLRYLYTGQDEIGALDEQGRLVELRILGQGHGAEISAGVAFELNDQVFIPSHDAQGNVTALADLKGNIVEAYRYTAFGERSIYDSSGKEINQSQVNNPWFFSSKRFDEETGFVYFGRRYYDPEDGRWVTADPSGYTDGTNLYAYLHHRPGQTFDLYGLEEEGYHPLSNVEYHDREPQQQEKPKENDEAPLGFQEKKKSKKDSLFFCGIKQMSEAGISWVNGIMNSLDDSSDSAEMISKMAGDHYVTFVYNRSSGFIGDIVRCFFELYFYMETKAVFNLRAKWDAHFAIAGPNSYILHYCHSEGAIVTRNALMGYPEELRNRIIVKAIAPGAYIDKSYACSVTHYRSTRDIVPLFDFVGAYRCRSSTVVLKPHPDAPLFDHSAQSPTYGRTFAFETRSYIEKYGEI